MLHITIILQKYLFLPQIFLNGVKPVEYDKLRFQPEIICNSVCEEFIFTPNFLKWCQTTSC